MRARLSKDANELGGVEVDGKRFEADTHMTAPARDDAELDDAAVLHSATIFFSVGTLTRGTSCMELWHMRAPSSEKKMCRPENCCCEEERS